MSDSIRVSVCIPAYNEEAVIADTIADVVGVLAALPGQHELLVVDDGSIDRTWEMLTELAARYPVLRLLRHDRNRGLAAAQKTLVDAARGDYIMHIGADGEWRAAELIPMLAKLEEGHDIVIGVRRDKRYTLSRKVISAGYNLLVALLWGKHFGDLGSIKLVRSSLWKRIPFTSSTAAVNAQRVLIAYRNGARIGTVLVDHRGRKGGRSKFAHPRHAAAAAAELIRFRLSTASRYRIPRGPGAASGQP